MEARLHDDQRQLLGDVTTRERYIWGTIACLVAAVCLFIGLPLIGGILALWAAVWFVYTYGDSRSQ